MMPFIIAIVFFLASVSPAGADPISAAIVAAIGLTGTAASVATAVLTTVISIGLSFASTLFAKKPKEPEKGSKLDLDVGGDVPRQIIFGEAVTRGHFAYWNTWGSSNKNLQIVYVLADWECEALTKVWIGGKEATLAVVADKRGADERWNVTNSEYMEEGATLIQIYFHRGRIAQGPNLDLVANANPSSRLTAADRFAGCCYVVVNLKSNKSAFSNIPEFRFQLKGARVYDPRKDSTVTGGSGAHRWNTPTTWEYTDNPVICEYNYRRGFFANGQRIGGMAMQPYDLLVDHYIAEANVCDEIVSWTESGSPKSEKRYRCAVVTKDDSDHQSAIAAFMEACAGIVLERAGVFSPMVGAARPVVATIVQSDLIQGAPTRWSNRLPRQQNVNSVAGQYVSLADNGEMQSYKQLIVAEWEAEDRGERIVANKNFPTVTSKRQAEYLARILAEDARQGHNASIVVGFRWFWLEPGDWINYTNRFGTKTYRIEGVEKRPDKTIRLELNGIAASVYDDATTINPLVTRIPANYQSVLSTVNGFAIAATSVTGINGSEIPALRFTWNPPDDPTIDDVIIEYRKKVTSGEAAATRTIEPQPEVGSHTTTQNVLPGTDYEARATIRTTPPRITSWTAWVTVKTGNAFSAGQIVEIADIEFEQLSDALQGYLTEITDTAASAEVLAQSATSGGMLRFQRITDGPDGRARFEVYVNAGTVGTPDFRAAGLVLEAKGGVGAYARATFLVDQFVIASDRSNTGVVDVPFIFSGGQFYIDTAYIRNLTSDNITARAINADTIAIGGVDTLNLIENAATTSAVSNGGPGSVHGAIMNALSIHTVEGRTVSLFIDASIIINVAEAVGTRVVTFNVDLRRTVDGVTTIIKSYNGGISIPSGDWFTQVRSISGVWIDEPPGDADVSYDLRFLRTISGVGVTVAYTANTIYALITKR